MTKQEKKPLILLTETELDHVAGGANADPLRIADPFNTIPQLLNLPWWAVELQDGAPSFLIRNRGLLG